MTTTQTTRSYTSIPYHHLPTPQGDLLVWVTGRQSDAGIGIGVRTEQAHNRGDVNAPEGGWDGILETITINRVDYWAHEHFYLGEDGTLSTTQRWSNPIRRAQPFSMAGRDVSPSARDKASQLLAEAVAAWVETDAGRAAITEGERIRVNNELLEVERKLTEVQAQLDELTAERDALLALEG